VGEVEDIFARMTRAELELYRALGGQLTAGQQRRLLGKTMELLELVPAADVARDAAAGRAPGAADP
jgi:hypothetical protein